MTDRVCDWCKQEPELMHTDKGQPCWFFIIKNGQDEPISMILDQKDKIEYVFQVCLDRNPILQEGEQAICGKCLDKFYPDDEEET